MPFTKPFVRTYRASAPVYWEPGLDADDGGWPAIPTPVVVDVGVLPQPGDIAIAHYRVGGFGTVVITDEASNVITPDHATTGTIQGLFIWTHDAATEYHFTSNYYPIGVGSVAEIFFVSLADWGPFLQEWLFDMDSVYNTSVNGPLSSLPPYAWTIPATSGMTHFPAGGGLDVNPPWGADTLYVEFLTAEAGFGVNEADWDGLTRIVYTDLSKDGIPLGLGFFPGDQFGTQYEGIDDIGGQDSYSVTANRYGLFTPNGFNLPNGSQVPAFTGVAAWESFDDSYSPTVVGAGDIVYVSASFVRVIPTFTGDPVEPPPPPERGNFRAFAPRRRRVDVKELPYQLNTKMVGGPSGPA